MNTIRHNEDLKWHNKTIIAPRYFKVNNYKYYVHITKYCQYVIIYISLNNNNNNIFKGNVLYHSELKLYSNTKGLYFNFSYWINNKQKKKIRVYICE